MYLPSAIKLSFPVILLFLLVQSCKEAPRACIEGPDNVSEGETASYKWCGGVADNIEWTSSGGNGTGSTFTPTFTFKGEYVISARGSNKKGSHTTSQNVLYSKTPATVCQITHMCYSGNGNIQNTADLANYHAYVYDSKSDWLEDIEVKGHSRALDSVKCQYSATYNTAIGHFSKIFATESQKYVSVEYRHPTNPNLQTSNWFELFYGANGPINIVNKDYKDNFGQTRLDTYSKKILVGRWYFTSYVVNGSIVPIAGCDMDDYLNFKGDGTWRYEIGAGNCQGSYNLSTGTFDALPSCKSGSGFIMTPLSGNFSGGICEFNEATLKVYFSAGTSNGYFIFSYKP